MSRDKLDLKKLEQRIEVLENRDANKQYFYFFQQDSPEHIEFEKLCKANPKKYEHCLIVLGSSQKEMDADALKETIKQEAK